MSTPRLHSGFAFGAGQVPLVRGTVKVFATRIDGDLDVAENYSPDRSSAITLRPDGRFHVRPTLSVGRALTFNWSTIKDGLVFPRFFDRRITESLEDIRDVLIRVPLQSGKTTHVRQIARDTIALDATTLKVASRDPVGFVHGFTGRLSTRFGVRQKRF